MPSLSTASSNLTNFCSIATSRCLAPRLGDRVNSRRRLPFRLPALKLSYERSKLYRPAVLRLLGPLPHRLDLLRSQAASIKVIHPEVPGDVPHALKFNLARVASDVVHGHAALLRIDDR